MESSSSAAKTFEKRRLCLTALLKSVSIRLYVDSGGDAKFEENDSRCLSSKGSLGPYVTRLFFAINGPTRVHEEDELVKRLDNEVEASIEARDKSQGQPGDRHRGEVDDYRGGGFSRLEGRSSSSLSTSFILRPVDLFHNLLRDDDEHLLFPSLYYVATVDQSDPRACENYSRRFFLEN